MILTAVAGLGLRIKAIDKLEYTKHKNQQPYGKDKPKGRVNKVVDYKPS